MKIRLFITPFVALFAVFCSGWMVDATQAATSGPNSPGTTADDATVGTITWSNTSNSTTSNNAYTFVNVTFGDVSHYLKLSNFGFSIPTGATINGITVSIERRTCGPGGLAADSTIKLLQDGSFAGNNKASATTWPSSDGVATYGGTTDTWGLTWTASQINSSDFGVGISVSSAEEDECIGGNARVDYVSITVSYTEAVASSSSSAASSSSESTNHNGNGGGRRNGPGRGGAAPKLVGPRRYEVMTSSSSSSAQEKQPHKLRQSATDRWEANVARRACKRRLGRDATAMCRMH